MEWVFFFLLLISFALLIVSLIQPRLIGRFFSKKKILGRGELSIIFSLAMGLSLVFFGISVPETEERKQKRIAEERVEEELRLAEEQKRIAEERKEEEEKNKVHLTEEEQKEFYLAVLKSNVEKVREYLDRGIDINREVPGEYPLFVASKAGHPEMVKVLLEAGADVNQKDDEQETILHWLGHLGHQESHLEVVKILVQEPKIDINSQDNEGNTPLHLASFSGNTKIVKVLAQMPGIKINAKNQNGWTPFLAATAVVVRLEIVKYLAQIPGINLEARNNEGKNVLHLASQKGKWEVVDFLKEILPNLKGVQDDSGATPKQLAQIKKEELAQEELKKQASRKKTAPLRKKLAKIIEKNLVELQKHYQEFLDMRTNIVKMVKYANNSDEDESVSGKMYVDWNHLWGDEVVSETYFQENELKYGKMFLVDMVWGRWSHLWNGELQNDISKRFDDQEKSFSDRDWSVCYDAYIEIQDVPNWIRYAWQKYRGFLNGTYSSLEVEKAQGDVTKSFKRTEKALLDCSS